MLITLVIHFFFVSLHPQHTNNHTRHSRESGNPLAISKKNRIFAGATKAI